MRISKISYTTPSFGYNAIYHQKVQEFLEKKSQRDNIAGYLLTEEKLSLEIEDKIVEMEKNKRSETEKFQNLSRYLVDIKQNIAFYMEKLYPQLRYCDNIALQYAMEGIDSKLSKYSWRREMVKGLNDISLKDYKSFYMVPRPLQVKKDQENKQEEPIKVVKQDAVNPQETAKETKETTASTSKPQVLKLLTIYKPSESSPYGFVDVVGMEEIKQKLQESIIDYVKYPIQAQEDYEEYGINAPRGFLFYGPPGCGKTYMAQALAMEADMVMFKMDLSKVGSKYVNETSNNIGMAFSYLANVAKNSQNPIILFMDEVDSLAIKRGQNSASSAENLKATTTLLKCVEEARDNNIVVIAATNKYDLLDDAFKARFDGQIYFPLPDKKQIKQLLISLLSSREKGMLLAQNDEKIDKLSELLEGFSNRSIVFIIDEAAKISRRNNREDITFNNIKTAIEKTELEKPVEKEYKKRNKNKQIGFQHN